MTRLSAITLALLATYAGGLVVRAGYPFGLLLAGAGLCVLMIALLDRPIWEVR